MLSPTVVSNGKSSPDVFRIVASFFLFCTLVSAQNNTSCPGASYGSVYTNSNGTEYELYCDYDWTQDIVSFPNTPTFEDCLLLCDSYVPPANGSECGAATWAESLRETCYLKRAAVEGGLLADPGTGINTGVRRIPGPYAPPIDDCIASNNTVYTDAQGRNYTVQCGLDTKGNNYLNESMVPQYSDLYRTGVGGSYQECFYQCGLRTGCLGFTWKGTEGAANGKGQGGCYFKQQANDCNPVIYSFYLDQQGVYNDTLVSALREDQVQLIMDTCVPSNITSISSDTMSPTSPPTSAVSLPSQTMTTTSITPSATPSICPVQDGFLYTDTGGQRYTIYCNADVQGNAVVLANIPSLDACLVRCDDFGSSCGSAVYTIGNSYCYLKPPPEQGGILTGGQGQVGVKYYDVTTTPFPTTTTMTTTTSSTPEVFTTTATSTTSSSPGVTTPTSSPTSSTPVSTTASTSPSSSLGVPLFSTTVTVAPAPSSTAVSTTPSSIIASSSSAPSFSTTSPEIIIPTIISSSTELMNTTPTPIPGITLTSTSSPIVSNSLSISIPEVSTIVSFSVTPAVSSSTSDATSAISSESTTSSTSISVLSPITSITQLSSTAVVPTSSPTLAEFVTTELPSSLVSPTIISTSSLLPSATPYTIPSIIVPGSSTTTSAPTSISMSSPIVTSTLSSTASNIPPISASACAAGVVETQLSSSGVSYAVECAADTDGMLVAVVEAPQTYTQCFEACDKDPQCLGFTYVGATGTSFGVGRGYCYFKAPVGTSDAIQLISGMENFVSAVVLRPVLSESSSMVSTTSMVSATPMISTTSMMPTKSLTSTSLGTPAESSSGDTSFSSLTSAIPPTYSDESVSSGNPESTSTPAITSPVNMPSSLGATSTTTASLSTSSTTTAAACSATGQQTFTSDSGYEYDFQCGAIISEDSTLDQLNVQASTSYTQCFAFCDSAALCDAFVYVGAIAGSGPGICSLILRPSYADLPSSLTFEEGLSFTVAAIRRRTTAAPSSASTMTSTSTPAASSCLATAVSTIVSTAGNTYRTQCGAHTSGGIEILTFMVMRGSQDCYMFCDANEYCVAFTYQDSQQQCVLLGAGIAGSAVSLVGGSAAGSFGAVRVTPLIPSASTPAASASSTVYVTPLPSPTMSGAASGSSVVGPSITPIGSYTGATASASLKSGCVRRTTVIAVTA